MAFRKGESGNPKGRRKGALNKTTASAKEALSLAFEGRGGVDRLMAWAEENESAFYSLWGRLVPTEVSGPEGGPLTITIKRT